MPGQVLRNLSAYTRLVSAGTTPRGRGRHRGGDDAAAQQPEERDLSNSGAEMIATTRWCPAKDLTAGLAALAAAGANISAPAGPVQDQHGDVVKRASPRPGREPLACQADRAPCAVQPTTPRAVPVTVAATGYGIRGPRPSSAARSAATGTTGARAAVIRHSGRPAARQDQPDRERRGGGDGQDRHARARRGPCGFPGPARGRWTPARVGGA